MRIFRDILVNRAIRSSWGSISKEEFIKSSEYKTIPAFNRRCQWNAFHYLAQFEDAVKIVPVMAINDHSYAIAHFIVQLKDGRYYDPSLGLHGVREYKMYIMSETIAKADLTNWQAGINMDGELMTLKRKIRKSMGWKPLVNLLQSHV